MAAALLVTAIGAGAARADLAPGKLSPDQKPIVIATPDWLKEMAKAHPAGSAAPSATPEALPSSSAAAPIATPASASAPAAIPAASTAAPVMDAPGAVAAEPRDATVVVPEADPSSPLRTGALVIVALLAVSAGAIAAKRLGEKQSA
ncbi:Hypothetical protein CAP_8222 [Chondromyces apiculatus DSM 436]|uniref:Uncharacterized protein n=1 Tax=Chondromyces apiculatus DSM 436 TaxID=1192034 RepID=A0A017TGJ8_9BACT|nr:Hypothetical protein CAP_8222 [Chondromyces apiculatus DSM 436]